MAKKEAGITRNANMDTAIGSGHSGLLMSLFGNLDQPVQDHDSLRSLYEDMATKDETIMTALGFLSSNIINKIGSYVHSDKRIEQLVHGSIENLSGTIERYRRYILTGAFSQGYSVTEFTFAEDAGRWLISSLIPLPATTCKFVMGKMPDNTVRVAKVRQQVGGGEPKDIPAYKCIIATHGRPTEVYGDSVLKACYTWYKFKSYIPKFWAVGLDRFGTPIVHGKANQVDPLEKALANMHTRGWLATTSDVELNILSTASAGGSSGMGDGFVTALNACNKMIYRSLFLPSLLESGEGGGSYALGEIHWKMFNNMALQFAKDYAEMELEQLWRPLIEYNFGPQETYGELPVSDSLASDEKNILADVFQKMITSGVLDEGADNEWIRDMLRLPPLDMKKVQAWEALMRASVTEP